jgi:hypothetical protein
VADSAELERDLQALAVELQRLEAEYNMYFAGRLQRPPQASRARVAALLKRFDRVHLDTLSLRFRLSTLQARYSAFADLWDRGLRAREEGRAGPFGRRSPQGGAAHSPPTERIVHVASISEPALEPEKLRALYDAVTEARRERGEAEVPFHRFADLVKEHVRKLRDTGSGEVAFRVTVKDGKVSLTAKALNGEEE